MCSIRCVQTEFKLTPHAKIPTQLNEVGSVLQFMVVNFKSFQNISISFIHSAVAK